MIRYDLTGAVTTDIEVVALPTEIRPSALTPAAEYLYGGIGNNPAYLSSSSLRIPSQIGTTRRVGTFTYLLG